MLSSISWQQYVSFLLIAIIIYYLVIWIVYFKAKLPSFSGIRNFRKIPMHGEDQPDEVLNTAQHIMDEIRSIFDGHHNKNELILALQLKLKKYNQWDEPGFRDTINDFIVYESQSKCSIHLGEDDLRVVWLG